MDGPGKRLETFHPGHGTWDSRSKAQNSRPGIQVQSLGTNNSDLGPEIYNQGLGSMLHNVEHFLHELLVFIQGI